MKSKTQKIKPKKYSGRITHTGRNRPKRAEILAEVEHGGASYRFAYRYEIFRPFRPERNGLYNTALYSLVFMCLDMEISYYLYNSSKTIKHQYMGSVTFTFIRNFIEHMLGFLSWTNFDNRKKNIYIYLTK